MMISKRDRLEMVIEAALADYLGVDTTDFMGKAWSDVAKEFAAAVEATHINRTATDEWTAAEAAKTLTLALGALTTSLGHVVE